MPRHSTTNTNTLTLSHHRPAKVSLIRLLPTTTTPGNSRRISTPTHHFTQPIITPPRSSSHPHTLITHPHHPLSMSPPLHLSSPPRPPSALGKPTRKPKSHKKSDPHPRPPTVPRASSPALISQDHHQHHHSDTNRPPAPKKSRSAHRSKPRSRARSLSPTRSPVIPSSDRSPPLDPTDLDPQRTLHSPHRRTRTVTLNDQPTVVTHDVPRRHSSRNAPLDFLAHPPCKSSIRSKRSSKSNKRSTRTRHERRRTCTGSSDEAEMFYNLEPIEISPTSEISSPVQATLPRITKPVRSSSPPIESAMTTSSVSSLTTIATKIPSNPVDGNQVFAQPTSTPCPLSVAVPTLTATPRPADHEKVFNKSTVKHGRAKSVASILDLPTQSSAPDLRLQSIRDDWDMPPVANGPLTWQQRKKSKPKSASAVDAENVLPLTQATSNLTKKLAQNDTNTGISPLLRSTSLRVRPTLPTRRGRILARTPSAGIVESGPGLFGGNTMALFGSGKPAAVLDCPASGFLSMPPSPTPDRSSFGKSVTPTAVSLPDSLQLSHTKDLLTSDDSSLTWQQAIMRSSPPKNAFHGPLSSNHSDKPLATLLATSNGDSSKNVGKKSLSFSSSAFNTPVKSATLSNRKSGAHTNIIYSKMMLADESNHRSLPTKSSKASKRRNSMSSTTLQLTKSPESSPSVTLDSPPFSFPGAGCPVKIEPHMNAEDKERSGSLPTTTHMTTFETPAVGLTPNVQGTRSNKKLLHRSSTPLPIIPPMSTTNKVEGIPTSLKTLPFLHTSSLDSPAVGTDPSSHSFNHHHSHSQPGSASSMTTKLNSHQSSLPPSMKHANLSMYAGPQFHNSPSPAALPAPKFSMGS